MSKRFFKTMVAVLAIAAAATGPARAQSEQSETIITTSYSNQHTITGTHFIISNGDNFTDGDGMVASDGGITVTPVNNEYITQVVVTCGYMPEVVSDANISVSSGTKTITNGGGTITVTNVNATTFSFTCSNVDPQFSQFEVFYLDGPAPSQLYTVRLAEGTVEAANWTLASGNASVPGTQVLENVMSGSELTATYSGTQKVKSVKAVKFVAPAATVTTAPTATEAYIAANSTSALVNAGAANGGSMMYAVTTTNAQPASTADFSATIPTAQGRTAGTYYVWYYAKADANHSDSEIAGPVSVTLAQVITWNSTNVFNSAHMDDVLDEWNTTPLTYEGITITISLSGDASYFDVCDDMSQTGQLMCFGEDGDSFTFTAPAGKKFCKIEIIDNEGLSFDDYGGWTQTAYNKAVWSGTAANAVTLGTVDTFADDLNSIVFTLIDD